MPAHIMCVAPTLCKLLSLECISQRYHLNTGLESATQRSSITSLTRISLVNSLRGYEYCELSPLVFIVI